MLEDLRATLLATLLMEASSVAVQSVRGRQVRRQKTLQVPGHFKHPVPPPQSGVSLHEIYMSSSTEGQCRNNYQYRNADNNSKEASILRSRDGDGGGGNSEPLQRNASPRLFGTTAGRGIRNTPTNANHENIALSCSAVSGKAQ